MFSSCEDISYELSVTSDCPSEGRSCLRADTVSSLIVLVKGRIVLGLTGADTVSNV